MIFTGIISLDKLALVLFTTKGNPSVHTVLCPSFNSTKNAAHCITFNCQSTLHLFVDTANTYSHDKIVVAFPQKKYNTTNDLSKNDGAHFFVHKPED